MAISTAVTSYNFNLTLRTSDYTVTESFAPVFTSDCGMNDASAIAFANAFLNLPLPEGTIAEAWVTRHEVDATQTDADLSTGTFS
jgi:hypothetical protein